MAEACTARFYLAGAFEAHRELAITRVAALAISVNAPGVDIARVTDYETVATTTYCSGCL